MTDMKCPFCQQKLEEETFSRGRVFVSCNNPNCIISDWGGCSKQIITELIRTRKALDVAADEITKIKVAAESVGIGFFMTAAISALAKIKTALEQKDVK